MSPRGMALRAALPLTATAIAALIATPGYTAPAQPVWSTARTSTAGCPSNVHVLTPRRSADYFAAHPQDLSVPGARAAASASVRRIHQDVAARHMTWLSGVQCKPGHPGHPAPQRGVANINSNNWSGYVTGANSGYIGAAMEWPIHAVSTSNQSDSYMSVWPGIGTGNSQADALIQAGTQQEAICQMSCATFLTPWFEIFPQEDEQDITNLTISVSDLVAVIVEYDPLAGQAYFEIDNLTTGTGVYTYQDLTGSAIGSGSQAEWIVERPTVCGVPCHLAPLPNFGTLPIIDAQAVDGLWQDPTVSNLTDRSPNANYMYSCDGRTQLAAPNPPSNATDFSVTWHNQGKAESC
jgi:hypothetical protein